MFIVAFKPETYGTKNHISNNMCIHEQQVISIQGGKASSAFILFLNVITSGRDASSITLNWSDTMRDGGGNSSLEMETRKELLYFFLS